MAAGPRSFPPAVGSNLRASAESQTSSRGDVLGPEAQARRVPKQKKRRKPMAAKARSFGGY